MTDHEWLKNLCDPERPNLATPFASTIDGALRLCACNGHALVALDADCAGVRTDGPDVGTVWSPKGAWHEVSLAALKAWAADGRAPSRVGQACAGCGGEKFVASLGAVARDRETQDRIDEQVFFRCGDCEGTGRYVTRDERAREGQIFGKWFNRNLLDDVLAGSSGEIVAANCGCDGVLLLRGTGWRAAVMPLGGDYAGPEFPVPGWTPAPPPPPPPPPEPRRTAAERACLYVLDRSQTDPDLGYQIGRGTEAFRLLCVAEAEMRGQPLADVERERGLDRQPEHSKREPEIVVLRKRLAEIGGGDGR